MHYMNSRLSFWSIDARLYFLIATLFLTLIFASLNPEGSENVSGIALLGLWFLQTAIPMALLVICHMALSLIPRFDRLGPWKKVTISGLLGALLFSPMALAIDILFGNEPVATLFDAGDFMTAWLDELFGVAPPIILVWLALNTPQILRINFDHKSEISEDQVQGKGLQGGEVPRPSSSDNATPGFMNLLPKSLGQQLVYIQAELHYIRVVTLEGEALILYNLKDAIADLSPELGIQTHRSYWIAQDQIKSLKRHNSHFSVEVTTGQWIPVSRRRARTVQALLEARTPSTD